MIRLQYEPIDYHALAEQVRLPDHIGQLMRAKRLGQRRCRLQFEQIGHG